MSMSATEHGLIAFGALATRFSRDFSAMVSDRNFSSEYLARRCRTTADEISSWKTGASAPSSLAWEYLCRADRGFLSLYDAWLESSTSPPGPPHPALVCDPVDSPPGAQGSDPAEADPVSGPMGTPQPEDPSRARAQYPGEVESVDPDLDGRLQVDYVCKIGRGKFIRLVLPASMMRSEAERICTFIMTQVD